MRIALIVLLLLVTACGTTAPTAPTAPPTTASAPVTPSSVAPAVLAWRDSGTSSGVLIQLNEPELSADAVIGVDGKPDATQRYVLLPGTARNATTGKARLTFKGRVGQKEAPAVAGTNDDVGEFLPGEGGEFRQRMRVPAEAKELIVEVYANIDQQPTQGRLTFKGPLPS